MSLLPYFDDLDMLKNQFLSSTTWLSSTNHQNLDLDMNSVFKLDKGLFTADFDLCHYKPEEITVKAQGNVIEIEGKHSESTGSQKSSRQFMRKFTVPQGSDINNIITKMSSNGILTLSMPKIRKESKEVPIVRLGVLDKPWMRQEQSHNSSTRSEEFTQTQQSTTRSDKFQQSQTAQSKLQEEISSKRVEERQIPVVQESNKQIQSTENEFRRNISEYKSVPIVQSSSKHEEVSIRQEQSTVQNKVPVVQKVFQQDYVEIVENKNSTNTVQERQIPVKMESHVVEERREESKVNQKQVVPIVQTNFGNEQVKVVQSESKQTTEYIKERQIPVVQESSTLIKEKQEESEVRKQVLSRAPVVQTSFEEVQVIQKNFNSNNVQQQSFVQESVEKSSNFEQNSSKINQNKERQIPIVQEGTLQSTLIKETQEIQNKNLNNRNIKQTVCQENTQKTSSTVKNEEIQIPIVQEGTTIVKERQTESTIHKEIRPVVETSFEEIQVVQKSNFDSGNVKQTFVEENVEKSRNVQQNTSVIQTNESLIPITQEGKLNSTLVKEKQVETVVQKEIPNIKDVQFVQSDDFQKSFQQNVAIIKERNLENTTVKEKQIPIVQQSKTDSTITKEDTVIQRDVPVMPKGFKDIEVVENRNVNKANVEHHSTVVKQSVNKSDSFEENVSVVQKLNNQTVINDKQNPVVKERVETTSIVETREESVFQDNIPLTRRNVEEIQTAVSNKSNVEHQHHASRVEENYEKSNVSKKSVEDIQTVQNVSQQHHSNIKQQSIEKSENVSENQINIREKQSPIVQEHATVITERRQVQSKIQNNVPVLQNTFEEQEIAVIKDGKVTKHHQSSVVQENLAQNKEKAIQDSSSIQRNSNIEKKNVVQKECNTSNRFEQEISNNSSVIERQEETKISRAPKVQSSYEIEETTSVVESNNSKGVQETHHTFEQVRRNSNNKFEQEFSSVTQRQTPTVQQGTSKVQNISEQHETSQNKLEQISKPLSQNKEHSSTVIKESRRESNVEYKQINDMPVVQTTSVQEEEIQIMQKGGFGVRQRSEESTTRKNFRKESIESIGGVQIEELDNCSVYSADLNRPIVESPMDQRFNPMSP